MQWKQAITDYQNYLKIERGLSHNSVASYTLDIKKLLSWLDVNSIIISPISISEENLQQFIYHIAKEVNPRTQSRIISGLRGFFQLPYF